MTLKESLNLPNPDFTIPMKADLAVREPATQARWDEMGIYERIQAHREGAPVFLLHDGPPYTNGPIHLGTALNKILKDFVVKSQTLLGRRAPYVPGFDNHGLPIEQAVVRKFQERGENPSVTELRRACRAHAAKYIGLQTDQFKRLGVFGMWDRPYRTMDYRFEAEIVRVFRRLVEKGFVYRGLRPVLWSPSARTALADTEIVYRDVTSKAIHVAFPLKGDPTGVFDGLSDVAAVIWTTTPWTIPANLALAFHPRHDYAVVRTGGRHFVVAEELVARVAEACGWADFKTVRTLKGDQFERTVFRHPVYGRDSLGVLAEYVTTEDGTGVVHTAPGHGRDDFHTGQKYGLPVLQPVDDDGYLTEEAGEFAGTFYKDCDTVVVARLREVGALVAQSDYRHSYPHAERDDKPVIFRATEQWFVSIDHEGLRERMLRQIDDDVAWFPKSGHSRLRQMISGRPDWCVSRQRPWGVGIPVFYGAESGEPVLDPVAIEAVARLVEREGSDAWYERGPAEILPEGYTHPTTGETDFRKETDVFDVWFDSGSTCIAVLEGNVEPAWKEKWPADLYLEGTDQHRGWFNVSMIVATALKGHAPFRHLVTNGFVTDEQGEKMAKRSGNVVDPVEVCGKYGADILRTWVASVNYQDDAPCSEELIQVAGETYRRLRNTLRFLLANLADYVPGSGLTHDLDRWIVDASQDLARRVAAAYREYDFNEALALVHNFCVNELSAFYLDAVKDRMYCDGADWPSRRSAQSACHAVLVRLVKLLAPIVPHTAEEVYARIPAHPHLESVHMEELTEPEGPVDAALAADVERMLAVRGRLFAAFEPWKGTDGIKNSEDVAASLPVSAEERAALARFSCDVATLFKVAELDLQGGNGEPAFRASAFAKCDRSRLRRADVAPVEWEGQTVHLSARDRRALGV